MTQETPAKVLSWLGVSVASMFLLFAVSYTNSSFTQTEVAFPGTFNPEQVVATLDNVAKAHSEFVAYNVVNPWLESYTILQDNVRYVIDEASPSVLGLTGLTDLASVPSDEPVRSQVAGAFTQENYSEYYPFEGGGLSVESLYSFFLQ